MSMFQVMDDNEKLAESNKNTEESNKSQGKSNDSIVKVNVAEQMDMFDFLSEESEQETLTGIEIIVPEEVISPLECTKGLKTKEFRNVQLRWKKYVDALHEHDGGSWLAAREKLIRHRDNNEPLRVAWDPREIDRRKVLRSAGVYVRLVRL
ncbi:hypothetical protein J6TS1_37220 [Siminovitchia terrae]|uniref:Uncharacterized protein n=1 Tax=Siminovitchia terrae TaxID=1914933 RepID=A0ABQ4L2R9_SIMTE|nr:hypothetical protein [Siminovitchia terrae]GIN97852.1 hypothetical protein J6TS1_37220 [Siminovitchia terrae]